MKRSRVGCTKVRGRMAGMAVSLLIGVTSQAQNNDFTNAATANWTVASAWTLGVPTSAQDVYHTNNGASTIAINVNTAAEAKSLTVGGIGGSAQIVMQANQSLTVGGDLTLASGAGNAELRLGAANVTVTLNGGNGSIINGGGAGTAQMTVQNGFSNSVGLLNASVDDLNMGQTGSGMLIITSGQTYNVANLVRLNNASILAGSTATILMNGGMLNFSGAQIRFNSGTNAGNRAYLILNKGATVTATTLQRYNSGTDAAIQWNDGTIANYAGGNLTIDGRVEAGTMNLILAGTGTHTFNAESGRTITVAATAVLADKSGEHGTLTKAGLGTLTLQSTNTYTGATTINAGTLKLESGGTITNSSAITVAAGAALDASATGLIIHSGKSIGGDGTVTGNLTLASGALLVFDPAETLTVSGTVALDNSFGVASLVGADWGALNLNTPYTLIDNGSDFSNIQNFGVANKADVGGGREAYFQQGSLQLVVIPEPSALAMMGFVALAGMLWRRKWCG